MKAKENQKRDMMLIMIQGLISSHIVISRMFAGLSSYWYI